MNSFRNIGPKIGRNDLCPCGSTKKYKKCCGKSARNEELGIHGALEAEPTLYERNLILVHAVLDIFGGSELKELKRKISGDQIRRLYEVIAELWPPRTNLARLLPSPDDNRLRALYLGEVDPYLIARHVFRFGLYADEIMIVDPFHSPYWRIGEHNPLENPEPFKADTLKLVCFLLVLAPWIAAGLVTLVPNPGLFDPGLRMEFVKMAEERIGEDSIEPEMLEEMEQLERENFQRTFYTLPEEYKVSQIRESYPEISDEEVTEILEYMRNLQRHDPLALEQPIVETGGQIEGFRTGANLETALYLCHLTGAFPYTSLKVKWKELLSVGKDLPNVAQPWTPLTYAFQKLEFKFLNNVDSKFALEMRMDGRLESFRSFLRKIWIANGGDLDSSKIEGLARDFKDELTDEYRKAQADWDRIDRDLIQWIGKVVLGATGVSMASAIVGGGFNLALPVLGVSAAAGVFRLLESSRERKEFRKKVQMSVFVDLAGRADPTR